MVEDEGVGSPLGQVGIVVGGALAVLAAFLQWASVRVALPAGLGAGAGIGQGAQGRFGRVGRAILRRLFSNGGVGRSISGIHTPDGRVVLALGVALLVVAALGFLARWNVQRAAIGGVAAALGAITLAVTVATTATRSDPGVPAALGRFVSPQVTTGSGVYLAIAAGAVAVVSGAWALLSARPGATIVAAPPPSPPPPMPPSSHSTQVIPTLPPDA